MTIAVLAAAFLAAVPSSRAQALATACGLGGNPVACENAQPGTPQSAWDVGYGEGTTIQGFAAPFSVNLGGTINFKIKASASSYKVDIYRMGYYGGNGARLEASVTPNVSVSQNQPACNTNTTTGLVDCGSWGVSASWTVPSTMVSGVYFAHIYSSSDENQIPFVVRNDASHSAILFKTSDATWQAYNDWGGSSLYLGNSTGSPWCCSGLDPGRAVQVSYNRPFATRFDTPGGQDFFFYAEYPTLRFLEENGYDVSYTDQGSVAADTGGKLIAQHKVFMAAGHDEYWSGPEVANVTAARNAGVSMVFLTGNEVYWKTRWAADSSGNNYRTLITYKESLDSKQSDPQDPPTWTGSWFDPRYSPPGDGGKPQNALTGQLWMVNLGTYAMQVPSQYSKLRFWRNTSVASLSSGQTATLAPETLGYEWDVDADNGFRPAGLIDMSATTATPPQVMQDYQEDLIQTTLTHHLTLYKASSGALVFGAGTVQWAWGLDSDHDGDSQNAPNSAMQQATVNLLADMGAQPVTLVSGLVQATASADITAPISTITSPSPGAAVANGSTVTISGTATDSGGVVAGVEVSTDGGTSWHPATTMSAAATTVNWSYSWSATGQGSVKIESRASDDSGNVETPTDAMTVTANCPCGMYGQKYVPAVTSNSDASAYELGVKFQSSVSGWVAGVRFYKGSGNTGTHTGSLWSSTGTRLATGTFSNETASGWQTLTFATPVQISANTVYIASYYDPSGHYASDNSQFYPGLTGSMFLQPLDSPPLTAVRATASSGNGVFNPGGPGFPATSFNGTGYGVDVIFNTTQPPGAAPAVTGETPVPGSSSNPVTTHPTVTFSKAVVPGTVTFTVKDASGNTAAGTTTLDSTNMVATFTPSSQLAAGTTYTVTVSGAQDQFGQTMTPFSYTFITAKVTPPPGQCPCSIWTDSTVPGTPDSGDASKVELGVKFTANTDGSISGVRFYKSLANTGVHTGTLWSSSGTKLATGTFTSESTQGWEELDFSSPVAITAGTTYVASYYAPSGHYAMTPAAFGSAVTNGPLTAPASSGSGGNGVYLYGSDAFPNQSFNASNYWVDVVYTPKPDTSPPAVGSASPASGATSVPVSRSSVTATFAKPIQPGSATFTLTDANGQSVAGSTSLDSTNSILTFMPSSALSAGMAYTASVSGAKSTGGVAMTSAYTWKFTTSGTSACPCTIWESDAAPTVSTVNDSSGVELGVRFTSDANGWISGLRFYKGAGNTGTHVGGLWNASGTLLAQATFTNETASGWQTVQFANAVAVTAGTTYVVGYYAPNGHYADDSGYFSSSGADNSPLHAPAASAGGNGVFTYGANQFPNNTFNGSNYWVDPIFWSTQPPDLAGPSVASTNPVSGQTSVPPNAPISFTFDKGAVSSTISFTLTNSGGSSAPGSLSYNSSTNTATFTPSANLASNTTYTGKVSGATDSSGVAMNSPYTWSFTTAQATPPAGQCPCSIWPDATLPAVTSANDQNSVELGVKFTADANGWITGMRFYKGVNNTGTHIGSLWNASGSLLGQVTFTNESTAGWEQVNFSSPIAVTANTTYIASYLAPNGGYAINSGAFTGSGVDNSPLHVPSSGTSGGNGVYLYTSSPAFPTNSYNGSNYWVDVVFTTTAP